MMDAFEQAHHDAQAAVRTFLPSLVGRQEPTAPPPPPSIMAKSHDTIQEGLRVASLARHVETMSARVARGLPPEPQAPPTPEESFGNSIDSVHIRALQEAIASHPETERARLISEAHDSLVKIIASHNGKLIVNGKIQLAHSPETAERLAATIVNNEVEGHDQRKAEEAQTGTVPVRGDETGGGKESQRQGLAEQAPISQPDISGPVPQRHGTTAVDREHPEQQPEVVPPGDGQQPAQGPPPVVQPQEAAKVGQRKPDGHQITQPKPTIAANQKLAADAAPELDQALGTITQQVPGIKYDRIRPQKSTDRLGQKVEDHNDPDTLSDYLGAQLAADSPQAKDAMIEALKKNFKVIEVDDQFLTGRKDKAQYPSANVQVQLSNGSTAEVQIVPAEVQAATEQSHDFYKKGREAEEAGDNAGRDQHWAKAAEINQGALQQFKARNGIQDSQPQTVGGYEMIGEPIKIGGHTFLRVKNGPAESVENDTRRQGGGVPIPADGSAGPDGSGIGAPSDADSRGIPAGASGSNSVGAVEPRVAADYQRLTKGQAVTLKDGTPATVAYVDPAGKFIRAHTADGKLLRQLDPEKDLDHAAAE